MLLELRVENLLLIERAELVLAPGLNVITGETGAGKTVLAHALDLLLGGRARPGIVRPGAPEAYVEGVFDLTPAAREALGERLPADADDLVVARRVGADGRTRAYIGGRAAGVGDLRDVTTEILTFYGQHEHRKLVLSSAQLDILDGFCGDEQLGQRAACAVAHARVRELAASLDELRDRVGARERELDLLEFELDEIDGVAPDTGEESALLEERVRLRHLDTLRAGGLEAGAALSGGAADDPGEGVGATALFQRAAASLEAAAGVDGTLDALAERCRALAVEADDLARDLRGYEESLDGEPGRLDAVEERLAAVDRLKRKHGGSVDAVLEYGARCRARREELVGAEDALEAHLAELRDANGLLTDIVDALRAARTAAAPKLAAAVEKRLSALAMPDASFAVSVTPRDEPGPHGADAVEFLIAPNPGVPAGPVREIASGGELSRVMLALMGVANDGRASTLVFDEVDAGIGGQTARAVAERLRDLAADRQVLCITHLPQIAALAQRHFSIVKDGDVEPARTMVAQLGGRQVVAELVRMLGADEGDGAARRHAEELLKAA
ncbi:MAG: repair protein RecN [Solirubrobacteraceae bacterium]|nr:repair protein RecN [Solirubrobacteraceae bacterium]